MRLADLTPLTTLAVFPSGKPFCPVAVIVGEASVEQSRYYAHVTPRVPVFTKAELIARLGPDADTDQAMRVMLAG